MPELGLVIPAGFDQAVAAGGELTLPGYVMYWVSAEDAARCAPPCQRVGALVRKIPEAVLEGEVRCGCRYASRSGSRRRRWPVSA